MKNKTVFYFVLFSLFFAILACNFPTVPESTPDTDGYRDTTITLTETTTQTPTETTTLTPTVTRTATNTVTLTQTTTSTATVTPTLDLTIFSSPTIFRLSMFTPTQGWAVADDNDYLLVTTDGGQTWLDATPPELHPLPSGWTSLGLHPFFLDETTAWFTPNTSGGGVLYQTQNSGHTWTTNAIPFDRARYYFLNANDGFALVDLGAGAGSHYVALYRTEDGGVSWVEVFSHEPGESKSLPEGGTKNGVTFLNLDRGWIGGTIPMTDYFHFYVTLDGGATWESETDISLPGAFAGSFLDVWQPIFINETRGYLPVRTITSGSDLFMLIYRSNDGGETWVYQNSVQNGRQVDFYDPDSGWIAAMDGLYRTTDGGLTWVMNDSPSIPSGEFFIDVDFVDEQHGWALTSPDDSTWDPRKLYRTTDGGATWTLLLP